MRRIAEMTGLSVATVSHVVNGTRAVSAKSRALVEAAVRETGYKPNQAARVLKTHRSNTVALVIPSVKPGHSTNFFFMNVLSGAKDALSAQGYDLIVSTYAEEGGEDARAEVTVLEKQWVDGMLLVPGEMDSGAVVLARGSGIPFVLIDRTVVTDHTGKGTDGASPVYPCVRSDNFEATRKAVRLLFESGKRRIAYIGGMVRYSTGRERLDGYSSALAELGAPLDRAIIRQDVEYSLDQAHGVCAEVLAQGVDAVFTSNNVLTMGVLRCLREKNVSIPGEVGVVGYEDYEWMEIYSPPVTTIRQQSYAMGAIGAEMLLTLLSGGVLERPEQVLEAPLIVRKSHG